MRRLAAAMGMTAALALGFAACDGGTSQPATQVKAPATTATEPPTTAPPPSTVTQANYDRITDGMTLAQVEAILGPPTEKQTDLQSSGNLPRIESWVWDDGLQKNIMVAFRAGLSYDKQGYGLSL